VLSQDHLVPQPSLHHPVAPVFTSADSTAEGAPSPFLARVFLEARTFSHWLDRDVTDATLHRLQELAQMPPTSSNGQPARVLFLKSAAAKERLRPALWPANVDKTMRAPVTAVVAYDTRFHERMPDLFPARPELARLLGALAGPARDAFLLQNTSLQAGYLILAARALGLDCGPMGGFDKQAVDDTFFAELPWRSTLLLNLGYGDSRGLHPRNPRLGFGDVCRVL
jgi:3-hydroxypropanoate dehydrogenase